MATSGKANRGGNSFHVCTHGDVSDNAPALPYLELVEATLAKQGRTKTWLSKRSGVSRAAINNWRTQPRTPQASSVLAVADALGLDHDRALRLSGLPADAEPIAEGARLSELPTTVIVEKLHQFADELARRTQD